MMVAKTSSKRVFGEFFVAARSSVIRGTHALSIGITTLLVSAPFMSVFGWLRIPRRIRLDETEFSKECLETRVFSKTIQRT